MFLNLTSRNLSYYIGFISVFILFIILQDILIKIFAKNEFKIKRREKWISNIISGILVGLIFLKYNISYEFFIYGIVSMLIVTIGVMDISHKIILDEINLVMLLIALLNLLITKSYLESLIGFFVLGGLFLGIAILTNGGIGGGDIKLIAPLGAIFGLSNGLYILEYTFLYAGLYIIPMMLFKKTRIKSNIALAPFIGIATISCILYWI